MFFRPALLHHKVTNREDAATSSLQLIRDPYYLRQLKNHLFLNHYRQASDQPYLQSCPADRHQTVIFALFFASSSLRRRSLRSLLERLE